MSYSSDISLVLVTGRGQVGASGGWVKFSNSIVCIQTGGLSADLIVLISNPVGDKITFQTNCSLVFFIQCYS